MKYAAVVAVLAVLKSYAAVVAVLLKSYAAVVAAVLAVLFTVVWWHFHRRKGASSSAPTTVAELTTAGSDQTTTRADDEERIRAEVEVEVEVEDGHHDQMPPVPPMPPMPRAIECDPKQSHVCFNCHAAEKKGRLQCGQCRTVYYCNRKCQRSHWLEGHAHTCVRECERGLKVAKTDMPEIKQDVRGNEPFDSPNSLRCAICLDDFVEDEEEKVITLDCRHRFHHECVNQLQRTNVSTSNLCPLCRKKLPDSVDTLADNAHALITRADFGRLDSAAQVGLKVEAEAKLRAALEREPESARVLNDLASRLQRRGLLEQAEKMYEKALAIDKKAHGGKHPQVAIGLNNLASVLHDQGKLSEAEPLYKEAIAIWKKEHGDKHQEVATGLNNLAMLLQAQGKYTEAKSYMEQALDIWSRVLGEEHRTTNIARNNLFAVLKKKSLQNKIRNAVYEKA